MNICVLQHEAYEGPGAIALWAEQRGHRMSGVHIYNGEPLPDLSTFDMLVVMGGSMSVYDEDSIPWIGPEKSLIKKAVDQGRAVLGVCLGAQLMASALGARVYKHTNKEIGWFPISLTPEGGRSPYFAGWPLSLPVFHWHGDTFDLPPGAVHAAFSKGCANQAFTYGKNAVGLQFHIETTAHDLEAFRLNFTDTASAAEPYIQSVEQIAAQETFIPPMQGALFAMLDAMAEKVR